MLVLFSKSPLSVCALILGAVFFHSTHAPGATFLVTTTNNSGDGSLRAAIDSANSSPNIGGVPDRIEFNIPAQPIRPNSPLPVITDPVFIDGYSQAGSSENTNATGSINATLLVELDGVNAGAANGLTIAAGGSTIRGLVVNRFAQLGVYLQGLGGNVVEGNFIGTDATGSQARPNGGAGIFMDSPNNTIGGTTPGARNLSSGNGFHGVEISGEAATGNIVQGNLLGPDAAGTTSLSSASSFGVLIDGGGNNLIGGTTPAARNVISGNASHGIEISVSSGNQVQGNFIGTDASGSLPLGNGARGMNLSSASNTLIGGTEPGAGNVISANARSGIRLTGHVSSANQSTDNRLQGNFIGTDAAGVANLGNLEEGIILTEAADNLVGGVDPGAGNLIAYNGTAGVFVRQLSTRNGILGNSIHSNGGLGIDLSPSADPGVTPNDSDDSDPGGNDLQNFPGLTVLQPFLDKANLPIAKGFLESAPNTTFRVEFFFNTECDPLEHGEGDQFLDFHDVVTSATGFVNFEAGLILPSGTPGFLTATATPLDALQAFGGTSEFSACLPVNLECNPEFPDFVDNGRVDAADLIAYIEARSQASIDFDLSCDATLSGVDLFVLSTFWMTLE